MAIDIASLKRRLSRTHMMIGCGLLLLLASSVATESATSSKNEDTKSIDPTERLLLLRHNHAKSRTTTWKDFIFQHDSSTSTKTLRREGSTRSDTPPQLPLKVDPNVLAQFATDSTTTLINSPLTREERDQVASFPVSLVVDGQWEQVGPTLRRPVFRANLLPFGFSESVSMNARGDVVAVGDPTAGVVTVYREEQAGQWNIRGILLGTSGFGVSVALSDNGNRLVVGCEVSLLGTDGQGHVQVYDYDEGTGQWSTLGQRLEPPEPCTFFGDALSFSGDGTRLVVGVSLDRFETPACANTTTLQLGGFLQVFELRGTEWSQLGALVRSGTNDQTFGNVVSMSNDGRRIAGRTNGNPSLIYVFEEVNRFWRQLGSPIDTGLPEEVQSVALSGTGDRLGYVTKSPSGLARAAVFELISSEEGWAQIGENVTDQDGCCEFLRYFNTISMSNDGNFFLFGNQGNRAANGTSSDDFTGSARMFGLVQENISNRTWERQGQVLRGIDQPGQEIWFGYATAMNANATRIVVGATSGNYIQIFEFQQDTSNLACKAGEWQTNGNFSVTENPDVLLLSEDGQTALVASRGMLQIVVERDFFQLIDFSNTNDVLRSVDLASNGQRAIVSLKNRTNAQSVAGAIQVYQRLEDGNWTLIVDRFFYGNVFDVSSSTDGSILAAVVQNMGAPSLRIEVFNLGADTFFRLTAIITDAAFNCNTTVQLSADGSAFTATSINAGNGTSTIQFFSLQDGQWIQSLPPLQTQSNTKEAVALVRNGGNLTTTISEGAEGREATVFSLVNNEWNQVGPSLSMLNLSKTNQTAFARDSGTIGVVTSSAEGNFLVSFYLVSSTGFVLRDSLALGVDDGGNYTAITLDGLGGQFAIASESGVVSLYTRCSNPTTVE